MRGYQGATASMLSWWKRHGVTQGLVWFKGEIFYWIDLRIGHYFKAIIHFRYRRKKKVHRFTGFTEGNGERLLFSMKCFTFWENIKTISIPILDSENYGFILNTCHDTVKRAETRVGFPVIFSRLRLSLNFHRFVILCCDTRSVGLGQYCLPKVYNGFNKTHKKLHSRVSFILYIMCRLNHLE